MGFNCYLGDDFVNSFSDDVASWFILTSNLIPALETMSNKMLPNDWPIPSWDPAEGGNTLLTKDLLLISNSGISNCWMLPRLGHLQVLIMKHALTVSSNWKPGRRQCVCHGGRESMKLAHKLTKQRFSLRVLEAGVLLQAKERHHMCSSLSNV